MSPSAKKQQSKFSHHEFLQHTQHTRHCCMFSQLRFYFFYILFAPVVASRSLSPQSTICHSFVGCGSTRCGSSAFRSGLFFVHVTTRRGCMHCLFAFNLAAAHLLHLPWCLQAFGQCILSNPWLRLYACIGAHTTHHRCLIGPVKLLGATYAHTTHRATNKKTGFQYPWTTWGEDTNYNKCTQWATVLLTSNMHDNITRQANMTAADMMDFAFVSRSQSLTLAWKILKLPMPDQRLEPDPLYKHILYCMASHLSCWSLFFISPSLLGIVVCATYADCIIYIYTCDRVYVCRSNSQHSMRCLHSVLCINDGRQFDVKGQMKYIQQKQRKKMFLDRRNI